nr:hypothetical protein [Tanacetum cinerariifolium]
YLQHEHYALWEVIEFGDSYKAPPEKTSKDKGPTGEVSSSTKKKGITVAKTAKDIQKRKNDVKARTTILLALPDEHQLRFNTYNCAKELWEAILKTFGGNKATKKTKKNQLKQQYGNFKAEGSKTLEQTFNRLQAIRNRDDLDTMSLDDVYNHLKVYEPEVQKRAGSNSQNMAFISSSNTSSGKSEVPTVQGAFTASTQVPTVSTDTGKKITIQGSDVASFDKSKVECFNCHKMGHFAREYISPRSQDKGRRERERESYKKDPKVEEPVPKAMITIDGIRWDCSYMVEEDEASKNHALVADKKKKNKDNLNTKISKLNEELSDCETDLYNYKRGLSQVEARLVKFKENEIKYCEKIRVLERYIELKDNKNEYLMNELEEVKKEKESIDIKIEHFKNASKDLDRLLGSQKIDKDMKGVGYNKYYAIPPPPAQVNSPPKKDLSWMGLPEFVDDTVTDYTRTTPSIDVSKSPMIKFVKETGCSNSTKVNNTKNARKPTVKYAEMQPKDNIDDKGYWDSGCSRHMTDNISYLFEYEPFNGGYVSFGHGRGKITGKGSIKTGKLEFENVYFMEELKYNLFINESMLWHRRLGHLNFKTMNKLVRSDLVKGLPSKRFENDHSCVACLKGKQHKASCKSKLVNSVSKPLHTLHMDLFGPTSVSSLNHKWILRNFITEIENLKDLKVKIIRSDNGGEYRNKEMDEFCSRKGIKREFSNARTPQQNGIAERRNRTLIEAARTMVLVTKSHNKTPYELFNERSPAIGFLRPFGCHVMILNTLDHLGKFDAKGNEGYFVGYSLSSKAFRVFNKRTKKIEENLHVDFLENKSIEKGTGPDWLFDIDTLANSINYVPVVVAGTSSTNISGTKEDIDQAVKGKESPLRFIALLNWFHEVQMATSNEAAKKDDAIPNNNSPQKEQQEVNEDKEVPESSRNSNPTASLKVSTNDSFELASSSTVETKVPTVSSPVPPDSLYVPSITSSVPRIISKGGSSFPEPLSLGNAMSFKNRLEDLFGDTSNAVSLNEVEADLGNMEIAIQVSPTLTLRIHKDHPMSQIISPVDTPVQTRQKNKDVDKQSFIATIHQKTNPDLLQYCLFSCFLSQEEPKKIVDALKYLSWVEAMQQELLQFKIQNVWEEGINYEEVFVPVARIEDIRLFLAYASYMGYTVYQMDVKNAFLYGTIDEELCREFKALMHDKFQMSAMGELNVFLGLQVLQKKYGIFFSQDKDVGDILKKFGYTDIREAKTPMDRENPWGKDGTSKDVELNLYRSMIGSLMYLTALRPDIMFDVHAYARHQVTPKECHLHAVKRIFRYLKGNLKLGLWYPKESPFDLVAYLDGDYGGANQDRKSTTGGCQFWGKRLISWQCKK